MLSENQNRKDWRAELDNLATQPDGAFDRNEAWEKLHQRLSAQKHKKSVASYWVAAAVAASVIFIFFFNRNPQPTTSRNESITKTGATKGSKPETEPVARQNAKPHTQLKIQQPYPYPSATTQAKQKRVQPSNTKPTRSMDTAVTIAQNSYEPTQPQSDSPAEVMLVQPTKRKLRVVHVNELGLPEEDKGRFVRAEAAAPKMKMLSGGNFSNASFDNHSGDDILKIKLSSNN